MPWESNPLVVPAKDDGSHYPLGLAYLHSYLESRGHHVTTLWLNNHPEKCIETVCNAIEHQGTYLISFSMLAMNRVSTYVAIEYVHRRFPLVKIVLGGLHATIMYHQLLQRYPYVIVVRGEGEETLAEIAAGKDNSEIKGIAYNYGGVTYRNVDRPLLDLDILPFPKHELFFKGNRLFAGIITSRGCPNTCLAGDTLIDTTNGKIPIKDLVGKQPSVLTRDKATKECLYAKATVVAKTGENETLVRVTFREGGYIDCTPDHRFVTFKNGNQSVNTREYETEAQHLKRGDSVRAIHYEANGPRKYPMISWGRRMHLPQHKLIMEAMLGRKLVDGESVHHMDHNPTNNVESNLVLTDKHSHLSQYHPELSQRMIDDNPTKNLPHEFFVNLGKSQKGKIRSYESRMRYRLSKLGDKNPNYTGGLRTGTRSRIPEVNHIVESVAALPEKVDVYCMEVPGYDWFYANDVLVHNCTFCCLNPVSKRKVRYRSVGNVVCEIQYLIDSFPNLKTIWIHDDSFFLNNQRVIEICDEIIRRGIKMQFVCSGRAKPVSQEMVFKLEQAGFVLVLIGLESGDRYVLEKCNKHITREDICNAVKMFAKTQIELALFLIVGLPGECETSIWNTMQFIHHLQKIKYVFFRDIGVLAVYPGTVVHEIMKAAGKIDDDYWLTDRPTPFYTVNHTEEDLMRMKNTLLDGIAIERIITREGFKNQWYMLPWAVPYIVKNRIAPKIRKVLNL